MMNSWLIFDEVQDITQPHSIFSRLLIGGSHLNQMMQVIINISGAIFPILYMKKSIASPICLLPAKNLQHEFNQEEAKVKTN
jgi:hypothetical protein